MPTLGEVDVKVFPNILAIDKEYFEVIATVFL
jgi:hypothetical protein